MTVHRISLAVLATVAAGCLALLLAAPVAGAGGWTSPLIIPAADFENNGVFPAEDMFSSTGYLSAAGTQVVWMMAGVYLPDGATITKFEAVLFDLTLSCNVEVELVSNEYDDILHPPDSNVIVHASVTSADNSAPEIFTDTTIDTPGVANLWRMYWIRVYACSLFQGLQGVRIHYQE